jgi:hypothetical protein
MRLRSTIFVLSLFCIVAGAQADDTSKMAKVEEFFKVAKLDQLSAQIMKQVVEQINSGMMQQMTRVTLTQDQQAQLASFNEKAAKIVTSSMSWDKLEPEYAKIYAAAYTEQQLDDILAFYKSSTGQVMVEKNPVLLKQSQDVAKQHLAAAMPDLQKLMKDYTAQISAAAQSKPPAISWPAARAC